MPAQTRCGVAHAGVYQDRPHHPSRGLAVGAASWLVSHGCLVPAIEERLVGPVHEKNSERVSQFRFQVIACVFVYLAYSSLEALYILSRLEPIAANLADT